MLKLQANLGVWFQFIKAASLRRYCDKCNAVKSALQPVLFCLLWFNAVIPHPSSLIPHLSAYTQQSMRSMQKLLEVIELGTK